VILDRSIGEAIGRISGFTF